MAGSKGKRDTGKYLQKLYLLLRRLDQNRRQQILAGLSEVQRRELERWMLEYKSTQNHGDQVQALTPDWSRRAGASKFFSLRGAQEHLLFASIGKQRTPIKVAIVCAIVTTIITYLLYKVYVDSMLRRRSEHQEEEEVTKPKAVPKSPKRERSSKALAAKPDESKLCCYDGLMRFASSRGTVEAKASRPNFSGTWSCVKAEGDLDGLYAAMGLGYFARCALERAQWGAGHLSRTYEHQGDHVKLVQKATEETTQEFDINGTPQKVSQGDGVVIQTTSWDDEEDGVLLFETKDLLGCDPNSWTHCRQYLQGEELVIEVRGARGHRAVHFRIENNIGGLVPRRRPDGRGLISRRRNGRMRYFAIVVAHRLELRTKEVDCLQVAMKYHSVLVDIKHQISSELGHQRMRSDLDEALAVKLWAKVTAVSERYQVHAEHDLGLYFRAVSPMMGTLLCGPTFHPRTFDVGIAGWQLLQVARGVGSPSSSQELQSAWDRSRRAFAELWAVAGRSPTETARRLDDLERRQSFQDMQKKRAIQQQRRDELKEIRLQKEKARSQRQQQRLEDRVHQLLAKFRKASLRLRCAS